jgi:hypothetical protein
MENTGREITSACIKRGNKNFILHYRNAVSELNTERLRVVKEQKQKTPLCYYTPQKLILWSEQDTISLNSEAEFVFISRANYRENN